MLENGKQLTLTVEEGNVLVTLSSMFALPEKLGTDNTYSVADRAIAGDEVRMLFRELRSRSPLMQGSEEKWNRFGPVDAWRAIQGEGGRVGHRLIQPHRQVDIKLDEEVLSGIVWCLLVGLHPASGALQSVQLQEDVLWPIAKKLSRTRQLRELIGITSKAQPKRWMTDEEYEARERSDKKEAEKRQEGTPKAS